MDGHRRQTLGAVSPNMLPARRASIAPARVTKPGANGGRPRQSMAPPSSSVPNRQSLAPPSTARRSGHGQKAASDPRPVTDKKWALDTMKSVLVYVASHGYGKDLDLKKLTSPQKKEWEALMVFLVQQVDPRWTPPAPAPDGKTKYEGEFEAFLKWVAYPFIPSKSAMYQPGNNSSWPKLLGVLRFLVDYLNYEHKRGALLPQQASLGAAHEHWENSEMATFFDFVMQTYRCYMAVDDAGDERITAEFGAGMQQRNQELQASNAATAEENAALQQQLDGLRGPTPLEAAQDAVRVAREDRDSLRRHISSSQAKRESRRQNAERWAAEVAARREQLAAVRADNAALQRRVESQPYTAEEAARMNAEKIKEGEVLTAQRRHRSHHTAAGEAAAAQVAQRLDSLQADAQRFNVAAERLGLIAPGGSSGKRAAGVMYEARVDTTASAAGDILSADLKGAVLPGLQAARQGYKDREVRLMGEGYRVEDDLADLKEKERCQFQENLQLEHRVRQLDTAYQAAVAKFEMEQNALNEEAAHIAAQVAGMKDAGAEDVRKAKRYVEGKKAEQKATRMNGDHERHLLQMQLTAALGILVDHQAGVRDTLQSTMESVGADLKQLQRVCSHKLCAIMV